MKTVVLSICLLFLFVFGGGGAHGNPAFSSPRAGTLCPLCERIGQKCKCAGIWEFIDNRGVTVSGEWKHERGGGEWALLDVVRSQVWPERKTGLLVLWYDLEKRRVKSVLEFQNGLSRGYGVHLLPEGGLSMAGEYIPAGDDECPVQLCRWVFFHERRTQTGSVGKSSLVGEAKVWKGETGDTGVYLPEEKRRNAGEIENAADEMRQGQEESRAVSAICKSVLRECSAWLESAASRAGFVCAGICSALFPRPYYTEGNQIAPAEDNPYGETIRCSYAGSTNIPPFIVECRQMRARREIRVIRPDIGSTNRVILSGVLLSGRDWRTEYGKGRAATVPYFSHGFIGDIASSEIMGTNQVCFELDSRLPLSGDSPIRQVLAVYWQGSLLSWDKRMRTLFYLTDLRGAGYFSQVGTDFDQDGLDSAYCSVPGESGTGTVDIDEGDFYTGVRRDPKTGRWSSRAFRKGDKTIEIIPNHKVRWK